MYNKSDLSLSDTDSKRDEKKNSIHILNIIILQKQK